jgi:hypothetical protein
MPAAAKTTHVLPSNGHWIVKKADAKAALVFPTKKEATAEAVRRIKKEKAAQVVVHDIGGSFHIAASHGLPKLSPSPGKSKLGRQAIKKAVSSVVRAELIGE